MKQLKKTLVFHPRIVKKYSNNPDLLRIHLTPEFTKIDFGYIALDMYINGGWIRIAPDTFIEIIENKQRYTLVNADGIPIAPIHHYFETKKDWRYFSLFFPSIPQKDCVINIIEVENGTRNDFNYYNVILKMQEGIEVL